MKRLVTLLLILISLTGAAFAQTPGPSYNNRFVDDATGAVVQIDSVSGEYQIDAEDGKPITKGQGTISLINGALFLHGTDSTGCVHVFIAIRYFRNKAEALLENGITGDRQFISDRKMLKRPR